MNIAAKSILLSLGLLVSMTACDTDGDGAGVIEEIQIEGSCSDYCEQAAECNDNVDVDQCHSDCESAVTDCMADEQEETLNRLDACSENACNEFAGCTIDAALQCSLGV